MTPGFYVARISHRSRTRTMSVESVAFVNRPAARHADAHERADQWRGVIQSKYARDDVFVIERLEPATDGEAPRPPLQGRPSAMVGYHVVRIPLRSVTDRMMIESVTIRDNLEALAPDARTRADALCRAVKDHHPRDDVFVIERLEPLRED